MFGNYGPRVQASYSSSPLDGLHKMADIVDFVPGCDDVLCNKYDSEAVGIAAALADTVVVCLGTGESTLVYYWYSTLVCTSSQHWCILVVNTGVYCWKSTLVCTGSQYWWYW